MQEKALAAFDGKKPRDIKKHNTNLVLSLFRSLGETTMSEVADKTSLSKTTISKIFSRLSELGIIVHTGHGSSTAEGGKRPITFALYPDYCYSILISAGFPNHLTCTVLNFGGELPYRKRIETDPTETYTETVNRIAVMVREAMQAVGVSPEKLCGIAILYDGIIDTVSGEILHSAYRPWPSHLKLREDLAEQLPFETSIIVDNASVFAGYAETSILSESAANRMVIVWDADRTLGYCMISGQELVRSAGGISGGFAHVVLDPSSQIVCSCGAHGCLQSLLSNESLLDYVGRSHKKYPDSALTERFFAGTLCMQDVFTLSSGRDAFALDCLSHISRYFAILIHNIFNLYSVQEVVLQGMFARSGDVFLEQMRQQLETFNQLSIYREIRVCYSQYSFHQALDGVNPYHKGANMILSDLFINTADAV